jgi:fused signal recognition particle receptor
VTVALIVLAVIAVLAIVGGVVVSRRGRTPLAPSPPQTPPQTRSQTPPLAVPETAEAAPTLPRPATMPEADLVPSGRPEATVPGGESAPDRVPTEPAEAELAAQPEPEPESEPEPEPDPVRPRFRDRLGKARSLLGGYLGSVLGRSTIDEESWEELEEALIRADVGVAATTSILGDLRLRVKTEGIKDPAALMEALRSDLKKRLSTGERDLRFEPGQPNVWLFVGVNGVGKTTTIGKIAKREVRAGRTVVMAAGDTFRAAAAEQLGMWAERTGSEFVRGNEGGDPGSVIYDAVEKAAARGIDLVLADTAGRLQTKTNLMEELRKIRRVADKEPGKVTEVLLVLDATTGQNGLIQAEQFREAANLTGVVLTKLDGTAKGGIALAIQTELGIPIKLVGLGESVDDLVSFDPDEFVDALFS